MLGRRVTRKEIVYRGLCGDLGKDAELGAERREGITWRSGWALQAAHSKVLGLRRVELSRTGKTAFQCDGKRGGGAAQEVLLEGLEKGAIRPATVTVIMWPGGWLWSGRGRSGCTALPEATDLFFLFF